MKVTVTQMAENFYTCELNEQEIDVFHAHGTWTCNGANGYRFHHNAANLEEAIAIATKELNQPRFVKVLTNLFNALFSR